MYRTLGTRCTGTTTSSARRIGQRAKDIALGQSVSLSHIPHLSTSCTLLSVWLLPSPIKNFHSVNLLSEVPLSYSAPVAKQSIRILVALFESLVVVVLDLTFALRLIPPLHNFFTDPYALFLL